MSERDDAGRKEAGPSTPANGIEPDRPDDAPDVPGFRTWRGVYAFVLGAFAVVVALLAVFTWAFAR